MASSFVCAGATAEYIRRLSPTDVTFVITGPEGEDRDCAEYTAGLLGDEMPDVAVLLAELRSVWRCPPDPAQSQEKAPPAKKHDPVENNHRNRG